MAKPRMVTLQLRIKNYELRIMRKMKQIKYSAIACFCGLMFLNLQAQGNFLETDSVVNTGYTSYTRESFTGSYASVSGAVLEKTPTNILSETWAGRFPGLTSLIAWSELSFSGHGGNTYKAIRGISSANGNEPLIIIDGVAMPTQYYEFISPKEIESVTVLKDASATSIYGIQGASGAIVITTKLGWALTRSLLRRKSTGSGQAIPRTIPTTTGTTCLSKIS
jgi:TonB-dependent SusC/RagA subfamily outer membrane receptor